MPFLRPKRSLHRHADRLVWLDVFDVSTRTALLLVLVVILLGTLTQRSGAQAGAPFEISIVVLQVISGREVLAVAEGREVNIVLRGLSVPQSGADAACALENEMARQAHAVVYAATYGPRAAAKLLDLRDLGEGRVEGRLTVNGVDVGATLMGHGLARANADPSSAEWCDDVS